MGEWISQKRSLPTSEPGGLWGDWVEAGGMRDGLLPQNTLHFRRSCYWKWNQEVWVIVQVAKSKPLEGMAAILLFWGWWDPLHGPSQAWVYQTLGHRAHLLRRLRKAVP